MRKALTFLLLALALSIPARAQNVALQTPLTAIATGSTGAGSAVSAWKALARSLARSRSSL